MSIYFNGTCEVFDRRRCTGDVLNELFIDPCSCLYYYRCGVDYEMLHLPCAEGTAFNYKTKTFDRVVEVFNTQDCDEETNAWKRCNVTDDRLKQLEHMCKDLPETTVVLDTTTAVKPVVTVSAPSSGINPGVIVGAVIAGAVFTVIIVMAIILYRRRQQSKISRRTTVAVNPEYFEGGNSDDPYAVINDTNMHNPDYSGIPSANGTIQSNINHTFDDDSAVYDNSGERIVAGYTTSLRRSIREYETAVRAESADAIGTTSDRYSESMQQKENIQTDSDKDGVAAVETDENGNRNNLKESDCAFGESSSNMKTGSSEADKSTLSSSLGDSNTTPNYFVLQKEDEHLRE